MLAMSDIEIDQFIPMFAKLGISVAFLVPTPTGYGKSIMDAIGSVRALLKEEGVHDYEKQEQGQSAKVLWPAAFLTADGLVETVASLYRPVTKKGDPRIWFKDLKKYCHPRNLLSLFVFGNKIYVLNLSDLRNRESIKEKGFVYDVLEQIKFSSQAVAIELLSKIQRIHDMGYWASITPGDPGVGDTLEHALGIDRNNSKQPDYKGIELKATRLSRHGKAKAPTRSTLFTRVPDAGMTYHEILDNFGKWQTPKGKTEARFQLYETFTTQRVNGYDLILAVNNNADRLEIHHVTPLPAATLKKMEALKIASPKEPKYGSYQNLSNFKHEYVSSWTMEALKSALLLKHHETFWVKALSQDRDGIEYFKYVKILHTTQPNASLISPLLENGKITVDLAAHIGPTGKYRDHGVLFKMNPSDLPLLLGNPKEYDLENPESYRM